MNLLSFFLTSLVCAVALAERNITFISCHGATKQKSVYILASINRGVTMNSQAVLIDIAAKEADFSFLDEKKNLAPMTNGHGPVGTVSYNLGSDGGWESFELVLPADFLSQIKKSFTQYEISAEYLEYDYHDKTLDVSARAPLKCLLSRID